MTTLRVDMKAKTSPLPFGIRNNAMPLPQRLPMAASALAPIAYGTTRRPVPSVGVPLPLNRTVVK